MAALQKPKKPRAQKEVSLSEYATQTTPGAPPKGRLGMAALRSAITGKPIDVVGADPGETATIPLPDEEELERARRKRNAKRGGGRASTVLTDDERLGG
jgi:hypothetical protein